MPGMGAETAALLETDGPVLGGRLGMILPLDAIRHGLPVEAGRGGPSAPDGPVVVPRRAAYT